MRKRYSYSNDYTFLDKLNKEHLKEQYVKITVLNWTEDPIQEVQGIVTGGNINLDGKSAMRRTCNLQATLDVEGYSSNLTNLENLFSINKKIYLEIGYKNILDKYIDEEIIWYPIGLFVIIAPNLSHSNSGITLSLQLKDKMCLLDGEVGGILPAAVRFDQYETYDADGNFMISRPTIVQIIRELVNHFGGEQLGKILISDIDTKVKKVYQWVPDNNKTPLYLINKEGSYSLSLEKPSETNYQEFNYGSDVGFIYSDFYYPEELSVNAGTTITSVLDTIKNTLGNFEYFYDIYGDFHFQEVKNYLNTSQAKIEIDKLTQSDYIIDQSKGKSVYTFDNNTIISSLTNAPQYNMIKNDFIVWGKRTNANNNKIPIRYHLTIDDKPRIGNIYQIFFYIDPDDNLVKAKKAIEYSTYSELEKSDGGEGIFYMTVDTEKIYKWENGKYVEIEDAKMVNVETTDWRSELYLQGVQSDPLGTDSNYYYTELINEWPKLYNLQASSLKLNDKEVYQGEYYKEVLDEPSTIDYYLDFISSGADISRFSVSNIGRRTKIVNDDKVNCVFEPDIPDFVIIEKNQDMTNEKILECEKRNQKYLLVDSELFNQMTGGGTLNSAYQVIRQLLHEYTSYNESIALQAIPIYYLEPNTRITVKDSKSNISGDYMISTISIPLAIGSTMSVSATRAIEKI